MSEINIVEIFSLKELLKVREPERENGCLIRVGFDFSIPLPRLEMSEIRTKNCTPKIHDYIIELHSFFWRRKGFAEAFCVA